MRLNPCFGWWGFDCIATSIFRLIESQIRFGEKSVDTVSAHKLSNAETASKTYLAIRGLEVRSREPTSDSLSYGCSLFEAMAMKQKTKFITAEAAYQAIYFSKHVRKT